MSCSFCACRLYKKSYIYKYISIVKKKDKRYQQHLCFPWFGKNVFCGKGLCRYKILLQNDVIYLNAVAKIRLS